MTIDFTDAHRMDDLIIQNNTGVTINGVWILPERSISWGASLINSALSNGSSIGIDLSREVDPLTRYNIMLRTANETTNGVAYVRFGIFLVLNETITFNSNNLSAVGNAGQAGGLIFYDKGEFSDGWRYLEAAPASSEFNAEWGAYTGSWDGDNWQGIDVPDTRTRAGTGKANTQLIVAKLLELGETGRAAQLCVAMNIGGKNDWFLPSRDELNQMYGNLRLTGLDEFSDNWYWSSSQQSNSSAWYQDFDDGVLGTDTKNFTHRVRAVRAF